jgi:hypothetical protein
MSLLTEFINNHTPQNGWATFETAAFGAFTGGWIASRAFTKRAVIAELNALSAAQTVCFVICNRYVALKKQIVLPMKQRFDKTKTDYERFLRIPNTAKREFIFEADYNTIISPATPAAELQKMIFEKTSIRGRALVAVADLVGVIDGLRNAIDARTEISEDIRTVKDKTSADTIASYLGTRLPNGHIDERHSTNLDAIFKQTDDCIFFSRILALDLVRYGNALRRRYLWRYWLWVPKMQDADWTTAIKSGLLPADSDYQAWLDEFKPQSWWQRVKARLTP